MIHLTQDACMIFLRQGPRAGYEAVFSARADQLAKRLRQLDFSKPDAVTEATKIQGQLELLEKHLPAIWEQVETFAAQEAAESGQSSASPK